MDRIKQIICPDANAVKRAEEQWNSIAKPLHSLGLLEGAVIKLAGITGSERINPDKRCAVIMCADNGVVSEGVTQTDSSVTRIVAESIARGSSNISHMAKTFNADVIAVDVGMNTDSDNPLILRKKTAYGTKNITVGAAMTNEQARAAITAGIDTVKLCAENGYKIIVTGEMGIGNTTTSSAIASVLLDEPISAVTGRGAGLDSEGLKRKISVVGRAVEINKPDKNDALDIIAKLGGFDIAGMTGLFLGGAVYRVPIVIDGFISAVSAALAIMLNPLAREYMLASHVSKEPAGIKMLNLIGLKPLITAEMCLGEGTGGILLLPLLDGALSVYGSAHRFSDLPMEKYRELD